ncbi:MAG: PVC-type heme-binding CxxCH protein [Opitutaceae bacterium]
MSHPIRKPAFVHAFTFTAALLSMAGPSARLQAADAPAAATPPVAAAAPPATPAPPKPDHVPLELFTLPDDLEIKIWAKAPLLRNPTNMDVDADGRIWIAEGVNYRSHRLRQPEGDRIMVLEDTDHDGVADKSSVFVQEPFLNAPLGVAVIDNQIIVSMTPDLIVYTDVNRDRVFDPAIDKREVLLSGFKGRNHDHSLHSVTSGPDGRWYANSGNQGAIFTDRSGKTFRLGNVSGDESGEIKASDLAGQKSDDGHVYPGGAAWRMRPDGTNLEIIGYNLRNSSEQVVTSFGDVFQNDNDDPPAARTSFLMEYGNMGYFSRDGQRTWNADRRPGQTTAQGQWRMDDPGSIPKGDVYGGGAPTGIVFYESDVLGKKWRGTLLSADAGRNTILGYNPKIEGAGYGLTNFEFLTSNKEKEFAGSDFVRGARPVGSDLKTYFRPSDIVIGPDGALYVADWFDSRVGGHGDNDEGLSGTIYRIAPKGFKSVIPKFDRTTIPGLITALKSPAVNVRAIGFQGLVARGPAAEAPVAALLTDENPYIRARAVWLLTELGAGGVARVEALVRSPDPMMRIVAFRALRRSNRPVLEVAKVLASDADSAVRREVALALRDVPFAQSRDLLLSLASGYDGTDRAYLEAWGIGCTGKEAEMYTELAKKRPDLTPERWPSSYAGLIWRLTPVGAEADLSRRASGKQVEVADRIAAVTALGFIPSAAAANALLDLALSDHAQVKAHALWWLLNYKDSRWKEHGVNDALKQRGIYDPEKVAVVASVVPVPAPTQLPPAAEIAKLTGDASRGASRAGACYLCHRIGDTGNEYGPTLTGFARRQSTEATITAIINPSAEIALGYEGSEVTLQDGTVINGRVLSNGDPLIVQSMGGLTQLIPASKLGQPGIAAPGPARGGRGGRGGRPLGRSLMLNAEQLGLSAQDVADLVAYLKTQ